MTAAVPFIDISHWQGEVNFQKMASQGVKAVLCKVSQGRTPDSRWLTYARDAKAAGLFVGGYLFMDVTSSASPAEQAGVFLSLLAQGSPNMLHMYDCEWDGGSSSDDVARVAYYRDVMARVDGALGRKGSIYTVKSFWRDYTSNSAAFLDHDLVVAAPLDGTPPANAAGWEAWTQTQGGMSSKYWPVGPWTTWSGWQFAVPPVGTRYGATSFTIDLDLCTAEAFARWTGQSQPIHPPEEDVPLTDAEFARIADTVWKYPVPPSNVAAYAFLRDTRALVDGATHTQQINNINAATATGIKSVIAAIAAIPPPSDGGTVDVQAILDGVRALLNTQRITTDE